MFMSVIATLEWMPFEEVYAALYRQSLKEKDAASALVLTA